LAIEYLASQQSEQQGLIAELFGVDPETIIKSISAKAMPSSGARVHSRMNSSKGSNY
jgi:hypothetical protein